MGKVLVTESYLSDIADAIREKNGTHTAYKPGDMADAIEAISTGITPTGTVNITQNGTTDVTQYASAAVNVPNSYAAGDEGKVVSSGALVVQTALASEITANGTYDTTTNNSVTVNVSGGGSTLTTKSITQNGTYNASSDNADGYSQVVVNVSGGSGGSADIFSQSTWLITGNADSNSVKAMISNPLTSSYYTVQLGAYYNPSMSFSDWKTAITAGLFYGYEYYGYIYGVSSVIDGMGFVLLGDFSQGGDASGNTLSDSITNYSAVMLQGIYQKNRTSSYNTSIIYRNPSLNTSYWAGMKDRNSNYNCGVTFTDANTVALTGNKQVIIYGIP